MTTVSAAPKATSRLGDRVFSRSALFAGSMIVVTLAAVAIFLIAQSVPAFFATGETASILTDDFWSYVGPLVFGTVWAAVLALL
ncbi:phosphate ABC transporter permease subunit PstC, partial [Leucobacter sp. M11]|nr:phosphate ABC transporter permease subunit PstC [Leucobacter sp. M11]